MRREEKFHSNRLKKIPKGKKNFKPFNFLSLLLLLMYRMTVRAAMRLIPSQKKTLMGPIRVKKVKKEKEGQRIQGRKETERRRRRKFNFLEKNL